jgi:hypothetical protein
VRREPLVVWGQQMSGGRLDPHKAINDAEWLLEEGGGLKFVWLTCKDDLIQHAQSESEMDRHADRQTEMQGCLHVGAPAMKRSLDRYDGYLCGDERAACKVILSLGASEVARVGSCGSSHARHDFSAPPPRDVDPSGGKGTAFSGDFLEGGEEEQHHLNRPRTWRGKMISPEEEMTGRCSQGLENAKQYISAVVEHARLLVRQHNQGLPSIASSSSSRDSSSLLLVGELPVHCSPHYLFGHPRSGGGGQGEISLVTRPLEPHSDRAWRSEGGAVGAPTSPLAHTTPSREGAIEVAELTEPCNPHVASAGVPWAGSGEEDKSNLVPRPWEAISFFSSNSLAAVNRHLLSLAGGQHSRRGGGGGWEGGEPRREGGARDDVLDVQGIDLWQMALSYWPNTGVEPFAHYYREERPELEEDFGGGYFLSRRTAVRPGVAGEAPVEPNPIRPEEEEYILEKTLQQMQLNHPVTTAALNIILLEALR